GWGPTAAARSGSSHDLQGVAHHDRVDPGDDLDAVGPVEGEGEPVECLLIAPHDRHQLVGGDPVGQAGRQVVGRHDPAVLGDRCDVDPAHGVCQLRGVDEAHRHGLAVAQVVAADRLEGVGEGVAVVQDGPATALTFVGGHHV